METKKKDNREAARMLAEVKGDFQSMAIQLGRQCDWVRAMLLRLDMVQEHLCPGINLNELQEEVEAERIKKRQEASHT